MTKMSLDADCRLSEGLQVVLQTRGMYRCYQLAGTLHRSAGADHLDDEKCRAETLDIIFLRWDVAKRQKLSCDGVVGPSFASMK